MQQKLSIGFSPCPNDCFIFDALVHKKIDTEGLDFEIIMEDVEALNTRAFKNELDITKLSFNAYLYVQQNYILLKSGSALGFNCGPLLVGSSELVVRELQKQLVGSSGLGVRSMKDEIKTPNTEHRTPNTELKIAIPGKYTTANFLLSLAYPDAKNKIEMIFSEIEEAVLSGNVDAGLIIHEGRFTYEKKGLKKVVDLGEFWENLIHAPIPLGGIGARRSFDNEKLKKINSCIKRSVEYAFKNSDDVMPFVRQHAQEMDEEVMKKHIALYVNEFSVNLGVKGSEAIHLLFNKALETKLIDKIVQPIIIN